MWTVISLGGSVLVPEAVDTDFLKGFTQLITELPERFVIITGGGRTARTYQHAARTLGPVTDEGLDWIGIHATRLNAELLRSGFGAHAAPRLLIDPLHDELADTPVIIGAGWKPGCSTDYDAALVAERVGAARIVNISNISHVYDKDPAAEDAKPLEQLTWDELLALTGEEWSPGLNAPFDPVAARHCRAHGITVHVVSADLKNLRALLRGEEFIGSTIGSTTESTSRNTTGRTTGSTTGSGR